MAVIQAGADLPLDLIELQISQIDLLLAMYPDEAVIDENSQSTLDRLRKCVEDQETSNDSFTQAISVLLRMLVQDNTGSIETLQLDLAFSFQLGIHGSLDEPPPAKVRIQQPSWLNKAATAQLMSDIPHEEDLFGIIEHIKEAAVKQLEDHQSALSPQVSDKTGPSATEPLVRVWFYFPSISTRSKRDDFIKYAPSYHLTGFLYAGKPGLLCVEGGSQSIDDYMKFIKTESWGDIPAHHKKVSERYREDIKIRVFLEMMETTDMVGERRDQRANRGDMKAMEDWLVERGLGDAFGKVLM